MSTLLRFFLLFTIIFAGSCSSLRQHTAMEPKEVMITPDRTLDFRGVDFDYAPNNPYCCTADPYSCGRTYTPRLHFCRDGQLLTTGARARIWDLESNIRELTKEFKRHKLPTYWITEIPPDYIATAEVPPGDRPYIDTLKIRICRKTGKIVRTFKGSLDRPLERIAELLFHDGKIVLAIQRNRSELRNSVDFYPDTGKLLVWDLDTGTFKRELSLDFAPSQLVGLAGSWLAVAGEENSTIVIWDIETCSRVRTLEVQDGFDILAIAYLVNTRQLVSISEDMTMAVWNIDRAPGHVKRTIKLPGTEKVQGEYPKRKRKGDCWQWGQGRGYIVAHLLPLPGHKLVVRIRANTYFYSPENFSFSSLQILDTDTLKCLHNIKLRDGRLYNRKVTFSPDVVPRLVTHTDNNTFHVYDLKQFYVDLPGIPIHRAGEREGETTNGENGLYINEANVQFTLNNYYNIKEEPSLVMKVLKKLCIYGTKAAVTSATGVSVG